MKRNMTILAALAIALAACSTSTGQSEPTAGTEAAASAITPAPTPIATPTPEWLEVSVTFDGSTCDYRGPTVVPRGQRARFAFANIGPAATDGRLAAILVVGPALAGTTWDMMVNEGTAPSEWPPEWADPNDDNSVWFQRGTGTRDTRLTGDLYYVGCLTAPEPVGNDTAYPAAAIYTLSK